MKSEIIKNNGLTRVLKVDVPKEDVSAALEKELLKIQKTVELKGFRKGKAPLSQVKAMYGAKASQSVLENLVNESYFDALDQHKLIPIAAPKIDVAEENDPDGSFSYTAEFEVKPEIELKDLSGLKVKKETAEVTDKMVEEHLSQIQESKAEVAPVLEDRAAKSKDWVKIDFSGTLAETNTPVENGSAKDFLLELGGKSLIEGFEDGVVGMKIGEEKTLSLKFPKDYFQSELAEKPVDFKVKLNSINKKEFPTLDDAFAAKVSDFKTLDEFKAQIRKDLETSFAKKVDQKLSDDILLAFSKMHDIEIPEGIVAEQVENFKKSAEMKLLQQGLKETDLQEYHKKWAEDYKKNAYESVKISFLVETLANKENLYPTPEDISEYFAELSTKTGIAMDKIVQYYDTPEKRRDLEFKLMEENVVAFLKSKATIEA